MPGGRLRVDFKMRFPPICECLSVKPPTVESLWQQANVVARVRITGHDRQHEYDSAEIVHLAAVLDLWKGPGQIGSVIQFNQHLAFGYTAEVRGRRRIRVAFDRA